MRLSPHAILLLGLWFWARPSPGDSTSSIAGVVSDTEGAGVAGARVLVLNGIGTVMAQTESDEAGRFELEGLPPGSHRLRVEAAQFSPQEVLVGWPERGPVSVVLPVAPVNTQITVAATRAGIEDIRSTPFVGSARGRDDFEARPLPTLGAALGGTAGVMLQSTTYGHVSPVLRGLTGYHTLILVDGVRFNTSIFRSGPNQYLAFVEPSQAASIEAILGPNSSAHGSDSLGGTLAVSTPEPSYGPSSLRGEAAFLAGTADASGTARAHLSLSGKRYWWTLRGSARRLNDLRAGGGLDSHHVFRRYFGLSTESIRELTGARLQDTAFSQYGGQTKIAVRLSQTQTLTGLFQRTDLLGLRSYRDQMGGLGRLQALFDPQFGQIGYVRYERQGLAFLDTFQGRFSFNRQADGFVRQGANFTDIIFQDDSRVRALGYTAQGTSHVGLRNVQVFGAEVYDEFVDSVAFQTDPLTGDRRQVRGLFPDGTTYRSTGLFFQNAVELVPRRLRATAGARWTDVRLKTYAARNIAGGRSLGVSDSSQTYRDVSFSGAVSYQLSGPLTLHGILGRGFRAPNVSDAGTLGLSSLGYEIPTESAVAAGALHADSAGENALSTGKRVVRLKPETLWSYELGVSLQTRRTYARVQVFDAEFYDPIVRRTLLFEAGQVPSAVAGVPVSPLPQTPEQRRQGVVTVATMLDPRSVKLFVNDGRATYYGISGTLRHHFSTRWTVEGDYSFLAGRALYPNRPVRRLPPQQGMVSVRYVPGRRVWLDFAAAAAGPQTRLDAGDLDDERIGASRRRSDIAAFFNSAVVSPYRSGAVFTPSGETLRQIQDRVLPLGATINGVLIRDDSTRIPLFLSTAGWVSLDVRGGMSLNERCTLNFGIMNLLDRNYRIHGSGIDAPGINAFIGLRFSF